MHHSDTPSPWIERWAHLLRPGGRVLDLACGHGRHVRWLAARGHAVTAVDRDAQALRALAPVADVTDTARAIALSGDFGARVDRQATEDEVGELALAFNEMLAAPGLHLVPLTPEIAVQSTRLPGTVHGDPADRILIATARVLNATLLTADAKIRAYGKSGHLSVATAS